VAEALQDSIALGYSRLLFSSFFGDAQQPW
jgi:hypothetical protein